MRSFIVVTIAAAGVGLFAGGTLAQDRPIVDRLAEKVVQKYQTSSCGQLVAERGEAFLNRVAAPIANKLFECGLIP
jgi:hypothetical protein